MSILIALAFAIASSETELAVQANPSGGTTSIIDRSLSGDGSKGQNSSKIVDAMELMRSGKWTEALTILDAVISDEESRHRDSTQQYYSARSLTEAVLYGGLAATESKNSSILDDSWAYAYFLKGFVLIDLNRSDEAKAYFDKALALAPMNAQFLAERGEWHKSRKDWSSAFADFEAASSAAEFSPEDAKKLEKARALRGMGFIRIEQGELNEAEKLFRQSLKLDPSNQGALSELDYIKSLKSK